MSCFAESESEGGLCKKPAGDTYSNPWAKPFSGLGPRPGHLSGVRGREEELLRAEDVHDGRARSTPRAGRAAAPPGKLQQQLQSP